MKNRCTREPATPWDDRSVCAYYTTGEGSKWLDPQFARAQYNLCTGPLSRLAWDSPVAGCLRNIM
jgi:hypothetical protein